MWSALIELYPGICKLCSSIGAEESKYVSERHMMSISWTEGYAFKRGTLIKLWTRILFRFSWQMVKYCAESCLDPEFPSTSPLIFIRWINNQRWYKKKTKNKKGKAVGLNLCFQFFRLKKALNIKQIKTKTMTLMVVVNKKLFFILLSEKR